MIIKLSEYDGKYRVVSLAKDEKTKDILIERNIKVAFLSNDELIFLPEEYIIKLDDAALRLFSESCNYDVFEIAATGNAYKYYDNNSIDNAILVTNKCNSNCIMCPTAEAIRKGNEQYTGKELVNIAKHIPSDAPHITITGGEPFLIKKDMFELLQYLKMNLPDVSYLLLTNGRAFCSVEYSKLFAQTSPSDLQIGIPLHGYNSKTHDYITQTPGSFCQTFKGIKNLLALGAKVELRIVVSKLNADYISNICELIGDEIPNVQCVKFIGLEMTGNAARNKDIVWLDYKTAFSAFEDGMNLLIKSGIDVGIYNFPLCAVNKRYWNICEKSISGYKVRYADACDRCVVKDACGGMFSGTIRLAKNNISPVGNKYDQLF